MQMWYRGYPIVKCPLDLWSYAEIIWQTKPDLIVETGTYSGGSALWFADQLDLMCLHEGQPDGRVISIDIARMEGLPEHERVTFMEGLSSLDMRALEAVEEAASKAHRVMVVLDSDHSQPHVLKELAAYSKFVTPGNYLIVEDTNTDAYGATEALTYDPQLGYAGHAVKAWKPERHGFTADERRERFLFTQNPGGYLLKTKETG